MRKYIKTVLIVCLAISTFAFGSLWIAEKNSKDDMKEFAQAAAHATYYAFAGYHPDGPISRYWDGVASFKTFQSAYRSVFQGTKQSANYLVCDEVYGYLIAQPEKSQNYIADIMKIMELLSKDIEDINAHDQMLNLRNSLVSEE